MKNIATDLEGLLEEYKNILVPLICKRVPHCTIYLFGSRARKDYYEGADIDIAIDADGPLQALQLALLQGDVDETNIPVAVDFVDLNAVTDTFREQVLKEGVVWKC